MKTKTRIFILSLILAAQVIGIVCVSVARERERANSPTFLLKCRSYDPRDILRGHYLPLDFEALRDIPACRFDAAARERIFAVGGSQLEKLFTSDDVWVGGLSGDIWLVLSSNAETGFWEVESVSFEDPKIDFNAHPEAGKVALRCSCEPWRETLRFSREPDAPAPKTREEVFDPACGVTCSVLHSTFSNSRFYLSEKKAKRFDAEVRRERGNVVSAELFLRADGVPVPKRLFVNGVEF